MKSFNLSKENTWVICSLDTIVCIVGYRINEYFQACTTDRKSISCQPLINEYGK